MSKYLHSVVDFYWATDTVPRTGYVVSESDGIAKIRIEHGSLHGVIVDVEINNIIDDSFDSFETDDEKLYSWYDGE